ncbi:MAG: hypothetical protein H7177_14325 [Rhizobacter sp.]|nr:hypothetical protein [Bacteriovorax sp.]
MKKDIVKDAQWENVVNIVLGSWIFAIPWVFGFGFERYEVNVVMWNFAMIGLVVIVSSVIALRQLKPWPEWLTFYTGVWLFFSPLFLVYWANSVLLWNSLLVGALISGVSALAIPIAERKKMYHRTFRRNLILKDH